METRQITRTTNPALIRTTIDLTPVLDKRLKAEAELNKRSRHAQMLFILEDWLRAKEEEKEQ